MTQDWCSNASHCSRITVTSLWPPRQVNAYLFTMNWVNLHLSVYRDIQRAPALGVPCTAAGRMDGRALRTEAFTCFDDVTKLVEQEFVVSSSVQTLLHVAVQFVHHSLHICVLVLLDTRHSTQVATPLDSLQNRAAAACLKRPTAARHSAAWSSLPLTHPSSGFPPRSPEGAPPEPRSYD